MVFFLILSRSPRVYILKQLFFSISVNSGFKNIYLPAFAARYIISQNDYSPRFQRIIVKCFSRDTMIMAATDSVMIKIALFCQTVIYPKQYIAGFMTSRTSMHVLGRLRRHTASQVAQAWATCDRISIYLHVSLECKNAAFQRFRCHPFHW